MKSALIIGAGLLVAHLALRELRKQPPKIRFINKVPFGHNAMTIPPFGIFIDKKQKDNRVLLNHEMVHWAQYQRMGLVRFYFNYASESIKHGYDGNGMEVEARQNETEYCRLNYTDCVRRGVARTVTNINFRA